MEKSTYFAIAIDGPVGVGKTTIAKLTAQKLGFNYIDTGAMYRSVALLQLQSGNEIFHEVSLKEALRHIDIKFKLIEGKQHIFVNGEDYTGKIRTQQADEGASKVATLPFVRSKLVEMQQALAVNSSIVMDGRDIASRVLPNADLKIYLNADIEIRAKRRLKDKLESGINTTYEEILTQTKERDYQDMNREYDPLIKVPDAEEIDTGLYTIDQVLDIIISKVKAKGYTFVL